MEITFGNKYSVRSTTKGKYRKASKPVIMQDKGKDRYGFAYVSAAKVHRPLSSWELADKIKRRLR